MRCGNRMPQPDTWNGGLKLRSHAYGLAYGYRIRIRHGDTAYGYGNWQSVHMNTLHAHGSTACSQFNSLFSIDQDMAPISSKLYNYMLQQNDFLLKILCLYRQIKKKKKAKNMRSVQRWWIHPILFKREEQGTYRRLVQELQLDAETFQSYFTL